MHKLTLFIGCLCLSGWLLVAEYSRAAIAVQTGQVQLAELQAVLYAEGGVRMPLTTGYTANFNPNGYGSFGWQFNTPSNATLTNARLVVFLDADLDRDTTTFFNEYGAIVNLSSPPGAALLDVKASGWEIDEPGFLFGQFAQQQVTGLLAQTNSVAANAPDDVALALSFALGNLPPNSPVKSFFFISPTDIGGLSQTDAASNAKLWFNGFINVNNPPMIAATTISRQQGSPATAATIATVSDDLTPAGNLVVTVTAPAPGLAVTNIANNNGTITANVAAACNAPLGANNIGLTVTDGGGLSATANLMVNVTANTPPTLGNYPNAGVLSLGAGATVMPTAPPADNGTIASLIATAPKFTGVFNTNLSTGVVTITNAAPSGNYTVTVTATDNCGAIATKTFSLTVNGPPAIAPQTVTRQQGSPASTSTIATVSDDLTPAGNLTVTAATIPAGLTITNITNTNGTVTASLAAACNATLGNNSVVLTVTDGSGLSTTANLTINVTANTPPTLGNYPPAGAGPGSTVTVTPSAAPTDNGSVTSLLAAIAPSSFTGTVAINQTTGVVTITNAAPVGSYIVTVTATDNCVVTSAKTFPLAVNRVTSTISDPLTCVSRGSILNVQAAIISGSASPQGFEFVATLPPQLVALNGTCAASSGNCVVTPTEVRVTGTLAANQTINVSYRVQVRDGVASGTAFCIASVGRFDLNNDGVFDSTATTQACSAANCPPVGPGVELASGSVLVYNLFASNAANANSENTRINLTNTDATRAVRVHLFFVDGSNCNVADGYLCLSPNQTASFLTSDLDPGTTGYLVAVAVDQLGCPIHFNYLIGDAYIKLSTRQAANLPAEAIPAIAGAPPLCTDASTTATLRFDGASYGPLPRTLALDSLASPLDGNTTLLVVNRIGGNLATGASTLNALSGLLYDDAEHPFSFAVNGGCQLRGVLSANFPRTTPRITQIIPAGRSGWLKLAGAGDIGILGAALNFNTNAAAASNAFNQGHNLHRLTLTTAASLEIPVFPPNC